MKRIYILFCIIGFILPYSFFIPFVLENGLNVSLFFNQLWANHIAAMAGADVIISGFVLFTFMYHETRQRPIKLWWLCVITALFVGVSLGFPLFLLLREIAWEEAK
jgi:hypothetical protein